MKNTIQILFVLICTFLTLNNAYAQENCNCILQYNDKKDLADGEEIHTLNNDYWVTMNPASEQNKRSACGNRCILPAGTLVVKKNGNVVRINACNNIPTSWEIAKKQETANAGTQSQSQSQTQNQAPAPPAEKCCDDIDKYLDVTAKMNAEGRKNAKAYSEIHIDLLKAESEIRQDEKQFDALLAAATKNSGGCNGGCGGGCNGGCGSGGAGAVTMVSNEGGDRTNVTESVDLGVDLVHLGYDVATDFFAPNGRWRQRRRSNNTVTNTNIGTNGWDFGN